MNIDETISNLQIVKADIEWEQPLEHQITLNNAITLLRELKQLKAEKEEPPKLQEQIDNLRSCYISLEQAITSIKNDVNELFEEVKPYED